MNTRKRSKHWKADAPNGRAVCVMKSWLGAVDVPVEPSDVPGIDFSIIGKTGEKIQVVVAMSETDPLPPTADVVVLAPEVTSRERQTAFSAFQKVTEAGGYGKPIPVDRGPDLGYRPNYEDDFELIVMRHREFRNAPDPKPEDVAEYKEHVVTACWSVYKSNKRFFEAIGWEIDDLMTYAWVFFCNYMHKYQRPGKLDNIRQLKDHVAQRLVEMIATAKKKNRNVTPEPDAAAIATTTALGHEAPSLVIWEEENQSSSWPYKPHEREPELNLNSVNARRQSAKKLLAQNLEALGHDRMIYVLKEASTNNHLCEDTRHEAGKQLAKHQVSCSLCTANSQALIST